MHQPAMFGLVPNPNSNRVDFTRFYDIRDVHIELVVPPPPDLVGFMMYVLAVDPNPAFIQGPAGVERNRFPLEFLRHLEASAIPSEAVKMVPIQQ